MMESSPCCTPMVVSLLLVILHIGLCFAAASDYIHDHSADVAAAEAGKAKLGSGFLKQVLHSSDGHENYGGYGHGCQHYESHRYYEGYFYSGSRRVHYSCGATCRCEHGTVRCSKETCNYNHYNPYSHNSNTGRWTWSSRYNPFNKPFFSSYGSGYQYNFNPHFGGGDHSGLGSMGDHGGYGDQHGGFPDHSGFGDHHGGYGDHGGYHGPGGYGGSGGYGGDGGSYTGGGHEYPDTHTGPTGGYGTHSGYSSNRGGTGYGGKTAQPVHHGNSGRTGHGASGNGHHSTGRTSSTHQQHPDPYNRRTTYNFGYDGGRGRASGHRTEYNDGFRKEKTYRAPNNQGFRKTSQYSQQSGRSFSTNQEYATQH